MSASLGLPPVLSPTLSPIWSGMLCPPGWSCLSLVCGLVSGLLCHLGWDAVSASVGRLRSCLPACLPSGLGCSVRLPGLVFLLSLVLSPQLLSLFCLVACVSSGMLCLPPLGLSFLVSGLVSQLVSHLVWDAVFAFLARLPAQLVSGLLSHPVFQLVWCVRALGLSPKFHVRFVQLFGVYGGVISLKLPPPACPALLVEISRTRRCTLHQIAN